MSLEYKENKLIDCYFNLTEEIVCINSIGENVLQRLSGADFDSDTVLLTDNEILIRAARRNYNVFKTPTSFVTAQKVKRYYTPEEQADLDIKTSVNKIGEIINLSQELNSLLWDKMYHGSSYNDIKELYYDICQLDVMSGIEIDKAKKEFDVNNSKELDKMREKYKKYFYTKNGRTYLSQKGREAYNEGEVHYTNNSENIKRGSVMGADGRMYNLKKDKQGRYYYTEKSDFKDFLDSLGAQKYLGKGNNWQPGNVGNLWNKYINTGVKGDAKQYMEYNYALNNEQQNTYTKMLGEIGGLYEAKFDKKSGKWIEGDKIDLEDFRNADNKWNVTSARYGSSGRTYLATNKEGKQLRLISRNYINPNVEENIDRLMIRNNKISNALRSGYMDGKKMTEADRAYYEQELRNNVQQAQWFQSQVGIQNTTSAQTYAPQLFN